MNAGTQAALRRINRDFYHRHAAEFDRTRHPGGWPGWRRVVETATRVEAGGLARPPRVLDLGCGNGRFALFLDGNPDLRAKQPFDYLGIDLSAELIEHARTACSGLDHIRFEVDNLETCPLEQRAHDLVTLFGVLHHLPGFAARRQALERAASAIAAGGVLALTCWQFQDDPRTARRQLDWESTAGIDPAELEQGDHLLRWGSENSSARRFCHFTDEDELDRLVAGLPLVETARYRADGPGERQNLYWLGVSDQSAGAAEEVGYVPTAPRQAD